MALILAPLGCGGPEMAPVSGKIMMEGKPIGPGTVIFQPDGDGPPSTGNFEADGVYSLSTASHGNGAVVGSHRVSIQATGPDGYGGEAPVDPSNAIPMRYADFNQSGLTADVKSGSDTSIDFDLSP